MHRRLLLKNLLLGTGAISLEKPWLSRKLFTGKPTPPPGCKVIIVGAGAAGLYAARQLKNAGVDVTVLEASQIHGGRIRALADFGDFPIELGAENVHGKANQNGNPPSFLYKDIQNLDPGLLTDISELAGVFALDGTYQWDDYLDPDLLQYYDFVDNAYLYDGGEKTVAQHLSDAYGIDPDHRTWHLYESLPGAEYGTSINRMSMKGYGTAEDLWLTGDRDFAISDSYLDVLDSLYFNPVIENIQFGKKVVTVDYSDPEVRVTTDAGEEFTADAVLVTVPISILKAGDIAFTPSLPPDKSQALETLGMDKGLKIIMKFDERWWPEHMYYAIFQGLTSECWAPGYTFPGATNNILTCFIMGEKADVMSPLFKAAPLPILQEMDGLFGNNIASDHFTDAFIQDWSTEPFIRGAYSYPLAGAYPDGALGMREVLALPVSSRVFFAGEATNNHHPATVHGALESGARAAEEILEAVCNSLNVTGVTAANQVIYWADHILSIRIPVEGKKLLDAGLYRIDGQHIRALFHQYATGPLFEKSFELKGLPAGFYIVKVSDGVHTYSRRIFYRDR